MARYRSILSLILIIVATLIVSCSSPTAFKQPPTYTDAQIQQIQQYVPEIVALRDRMNEIPALIQRRDWIGVNNFVHGPLGELRLQLTYATRHLLPDDQKQARQATREFFDHLVNITEAAGTNNPQVAKLNYQAALKDINNFLQLVPQPSPQSLENEA
ncbi:MAG: photosystem II protein PsbQ [Chroococcidiopsidaceae cyanobacterium CP_BM_ER_R8_30]|nr:photosystem II protein PsbQ [Chroococcidiopsidaceae cyanobacterium CP_BM_ER_R8_30]